MRKLAIIAILLVALPATAGGLRVRLGGHDEVPSVNTNATGTFDIRLANGDQALEYTLSYSGLQGTVTQAHIHIGQRHVNGGIVVWLCGTTTNPGPAGTQVCPATGSISGSITAANVVAVGTQQVPAGGFDAVVEAIRHGIAYVNVHTSLSPGGEIRAQLGHGPH